MTTKYSFTTLCTAALLLVCTAESSQADIRRMGGTFGVIAAATRGSAVAHDARNEVYLVVSAHGLVRGRFVSADGGLIGDPFQIQGSGNFSHFPRVAYSPDANNGAGAFLVSWHESDRPDGFTSVHTRLVAYPGALGAETVLGGPSWWEAGAPVTYATGSREFFVAWRAAGYGIMGARVNNAGQPLATINVTPAVAYQDDPSVAYNSATDEYLVAYRGADFTAMIGAQRVKAGTGQLLGQPLVLHRTGGTYITDTAYNSATNQFLVAWYSVPAGLITGRLISAGGDLVGEIQTLSSRFKAYDALSLTYNRLSATFLLASHDHQSYENGGVQMNAGGQPENSGTVFTDSNCLGASHGCIGNFYPRLGPSTTRPEWLLTTARSFAQTLAQRLQADAGDGGASDPGPTDPPPPGTNPYMNLDSPANNAAVAGHVRIAGWAIDLGAPTGDGVSTVHIWAWPTNGSSPTFMGTATSVSRPDVGAAFGNARFATGGFALTGPLPAGQYHIAAYAMSTVTGTFNNSKLATVTVTAPQSIPRMAVDMPSNNSMGSRNIRVAGWALDLGSSSGTGVNAVHVWAYPANGSAPIFVGSATMNLTRTDVGAAFGASRYSAAGFNLEKQNALPPGVYNLVVFARSTVANDFNNVVVIRITVL